MLKLLQLAHFIMVAEAQGFRAASKVANRSQAALSTSIKELEKTLGQPLFEPGNKTTLTPYGEICLPKIVTFLNNYQALETDLHAAAAGQLGKLSVASVPSVAAKLLPEILRGYHDKYPDVEVSLIDDNAKGVEGRLLSGEVDLAIGNHSTIDTERMEFKPLLADPVGVVCLKDDPLAEFKEGISWKRLTSHTFIKNGTCSLLYPTAARVLSEQAMYSVENITSLLSVLEQGIGITTLPKLAFPTNSPVLMWIPLIDPAIKRQICLYRLRDRTVSPQAEAFFQLCLQRIH